MRTNDSHLGTPVAHGEEWTGKPGNARISFPETSAGDNLSGNGRMETPARPYSPCAPCLANYRVIQALRAQYNTQEASIVTESQRRIHGYTGASVTTSIPTRDVYYRDKAVAQVLLLSLQLVVAAAP
eukprot:1195097-Prorocentrum_minimum.AAC.6